MNYPTAADLRAAANEAILKRCVDPHLGQLLKAASRAAAEGHFSYLAVYDCEISAPRMDQLSEALGALGIRASWTPDDGATPGAGGTSLSLSWD